MASCGRVGWQVGRYCGQFREGWCSVFIVITVFIGFWSWQLFQSKECDTTTPCAEIKSQEENTTTGQIGPFAAFGTGHNPRDHITECAQTLDTEIIFQIVDVLVDQDKVGTAWCAGGLEGTLFLWMKSKDTQYKILTCAITCGLSFTLTGGKTSSKNKISFCSNTKKYS